MARRRQLHETDSGMSWLGVGDSYSSQQMGKVMLGAK